MSSESGGADRVAVVITGPGSRTSGDAFAGDWLLLRVEVEPLLLDHQRNVAGPLGQQLDLIPDEPKSQQHHCEQPHLEGEDQPCGRIAEEDEAKRRSDREHAVENAKEDGKVEVQPKQPFGRSAYSGKRKIEQGTV